MEDFSSEIDVLEKMYVNFVHTFQSIKQSLDGMIENIDKDSANQDHMIKTIQSIELDFKDLREQSSTTYSAMGIDEEQLIIDVYAALQETAG